LSHRSGIMDVELGGGGTPGVNLERKNCKVEAHPRWLLDGDGRRKVVHRLS
jgi:hypothetical protein